MRFAGSNGLSPFHWGGEDPSFREFVVLSESLPGRLERQLGYFGNARLCLFYFDAQADGVMWKDGRSQGFGSGAWKAFGEHIEPLARQYGVSLSSQRGAGCVLLVDRETRTAYFADWQSAHAVIHGQHGADGGRYELRFRREGPRDASASHAVSAA